MSSVTRTCMDCECRWGVEWTGPIPENLLSQMPSKCPKCYPIGGRMTDTIPAYPRLSQFLILVTSNPQGQVYVPDGELDRASRGARGWVIQRVISILAGVTKHTLGYFASDVEAALEQVMSSTKYKANVTE